MEPMKRAKTLSERILAVVAAAVTVAWCLLVLTLSLGYQGATAGSTWLVRCLLLTAGALITATFLRMAAGAWRGAISRPLRGGRGSVWLASQPGWRLAIGFWLLFSAPELGMTAWLHRGRSAAPPVVNLIISVVGPVLFALLFRVVWRRQLENRALLAEAATPSR